MSVLIKGMEMPKCCDDCPLGSWTDASYFHCALMEFEYTMLHSEILDDCPLVEVPTPHGRLGDLDALHNDMREQQKSYEYTSGIRQPINEAVRDGITMSICHIDNAPTIIEAEVDEDEQVY